MNSAREWSLRVAFLCSGAGLGWLLASSGKPDVSQTHASASPQTRRPAGAPAAATHTATGETKPAEILETLEPNERVARRFESVLRNPDRRKRLGAFLTGLDDLTPEDAPALLALIGKLNRDGVELPEEWRAFVRRWGEVDGAAAAEHALGKRGESWVRGGLRDILSGWATTDSQSAAQWLNDHGEIPEFDAALSGLIGGLAEKDPAAATAAAVASIPRDNPEAASKAMEFLADAVVRKGAITDLKSWYGNLPGEGDSSLRSAAFGHVWWRLKESDIGLAQEWLAEEADKPWRGDQQYAETTEMLAEKDPAAALEWAGSLPPSPTSGRWPGATSTFMNWQQRDPQAASAWLEAQQDSPFRQFLRAQTSGAIVPVR